MIPLPNDIGDLQSGITYSLKLNSGISLPVRYSCAPLEEACEAVLIRDWKNVDLLRRLDEFPHVRGLLSEACLDHARQRREQVRGLLNAGVYIFGAYKVGVKLAREAVRRNITIRGFLDNDAGKSGAEIEGARVYHPSALSLDGAVVVIASGRHGNAIQKQMEKVPGACVVNMHEFLYALDAPHGPVGGFSEFVEAPVQEAFRYISTFLRLDDERSRKVFDALIGMRTRLSIELAETVKSPYDEEYFDRDFVSPEHAACFVDAGAFTGDTLRRLESHFGRVEQAYLLEPELPAYYEALKAFSDRPDVWLFNMGLDETASRTVYQPILSCDMVCEIDGPVSPGAISYIQGIPLDSLVSGPVGLFKLDVEGMEERALKGAKSIIQREKPVLAVCAYHRADDYWRLIDTVLSMRPDYCVAIRLYADILEDITLYFY